MATWQGNCREVRKRFLVLEEGVLTPDEAEAVRVHLAECASCRAAWERWQDESRLLGQALRPVPMPRDVAGPAVAALRQEPVRRPARRRTVELAWGVAVAAAAALLVVAGVMLLRGPEYRRIGQVASLLGQPMAQQRGARFASPLEGGKPVYDGDVLATGEGGELEVRFDDGSRLVLKESTELVLSGVEAGGGCGHVLPHVCLRQGEVLCELRSVRYFRAVGTPLGSAIVDGTKFRVKYVCGVLTRLEVLEGEVRFSCPAGEVRALPGSVWVVEASVGAPRLVAGMEDAGD